VGSYKTIDGRGTDVVVGDGGACFAVHGKSNVIIHGITIRGCKSDEGDGIAVFRATDVWIDHCTLEACADGLIEVTGGSTRVTLSNNLMRNHGKVMLLSLGTATRSLMTRTCRSLLPSTVLDQALSRECQGIYVLVVYLVPFAWSSL
jgi:pectate lyase